MQSLILPIIVIFFGLSLLVLINHLYKNSWLNIDLSKVDRLSGIQFEKYLFHLFNKLGYKTKRTPDSSDFGADLIIKKNGKKTVVQAKRYKGKVGIKSIQEAHSSIAYYKCDKAMVVTNNYFTSGAKKLAQANQVELIDRDELKKMIKKLKND